MIGTMIPACANNEGKAERMTNRTAGVDDVLQAGIAEADKEKAGISDNAPVPEKAVISDNVPVPEKNDETGSTPSGEDGIDVDLTAFSSTMVYSEVYNMVTAPEAYVGKTVKMKGAFSVFHDETADANYYACIIKDAMACCAQGIEFELTGEYSYPDDYPEEGNEVCVVGVFDTYQEGEFTYCTLRNAKLV